MYIYAYIYIIINLNSIFKFFLFFLLFSNRFIMLFYVADLIFIFMVADIHIYFVFFACFLEVAEDSAPDLDGP